MNKNISSASVPQSQGKHCGVLHMPFCCCVTALSKNTHIYIWGLAEARQQSNFSTMPLYCSYSSIYSIPKSSYSNVFNDSLSAWKLWIANIKIKSSAFQWNWVILIFRMQCKERNAIPELFQLLIAVGLWMHAGFFEIRGRAAAKREEVTALLGTPVACSEQTVKKTLFTFSCKIIEFVLCSLTLYRKVVSCVERVSCCGEIRQCDVKGCGRPRGGSEAAQDSQLHSVFEQNETWMRRSPKVGRKLLIVG